MVPNWFLCVDVLTRDLMDPRNRLFYASTFVDNNAAGLLPPTAARMETLVDAMSQACYGNPFQPDRCAILSQMVARVRTQDARQSVSVFSGSAAMLAAQSQTLQQQIQVSPVDIAASLAVLGSAANTPVTSLAVC